ncbi:MAG: hypothetical protein IKQ96_03385 [Lachnospiraceae bacterium]|nr:hypothetical protein [Lachnospiraceae bacterium]
MSAEANIKAGGIPWREKRKKRYARRSLCQGGRHTLARKKKEKVCPLKPILGQETYPGEKKERKGMPVKADNKAGDIPWREKREKRYVR